MFGRFIYPAASADLQSIGLEQCNSVEGLLGMASSRPVRKPVLSKADGRSVERHFPSTFMKYVGFMREPGNLDDLGAALSGVL